MQNLKKELLFSGGTGVSSYILGFSYGLTKLLGKDKLKEYSLGGISAGFGTAFLVYCANYSKTDLKLLYEMTLRDLYKSENKYQIPSFMVKPESIDKFLKKSWEYYSQMNLPNINGRVYTYVSQYQQYKLVPVLVDSFDNEEDFIEGFKATIQLPFITINSFVANYKGIKTLKGTFTRPIPYKYDDSYKIFVNARPSYFIKNVKDVQNLKVLNIKDVQKLVYPLDYWFWNVQWADKMFNKGEEAAYLLENEIKTIFI